MQRDDAGNVGGTEIELRTIVVEKGSVTAALVLGQDVNLAGELGVPAPDKEITPAAGTPAFIYDAAMAYAQDGVPLIVIGGEDYGMGSSLSLIHI